MLERMRIGFVGGRGMLGHAMVLGLLKAGMPAANLTIFSRSDRPLPAVFEGVGLSQELGEISDLCDIAVLVLPPAEAGALRIRFEGRLVASVMAGVDFSRLGRIAPGAQLVRAMSSPAASGGLAYSPWVAQEEPTSDMVVQIETMFGALGQCDRLEREADLALFTAMTGPVPGFVALFAEYMQDYLEEHGIAPETADRATRQLFLGAGQLLSSEAPRAAQHVQGMIDYDGTTAAGLRVMRKSGIREGIFVGLDAAAQKAREIGG
ncbi:pyrroline-5-carboxylate reductase family protein [Thioclava kandeliae]|uniref:Pyrroline-5-carboxylate reductase dimerization domain-containing protein n=1 Tax=Thioclava kandeliae TaxID=3070818 RepID=A0ABV1SDM4_9RHOB